MWGRGGRRTGDLRARPDRRYSLAGSRTPPGVSFGPLHPDTGNKIKIPGSGLYPPSSAVRATSPQGCVVGSALAIPRHLPAFRTTWFFQRRTVAAQRAPTATSQGDGDQPFWGRDSPVMDPKAALGHGCCEVTGGHPPRALCPLQPLLHRMAQGRLDLGWRRGAQGPAQGGLGAEIPGSGEERSGEGWVLPLSPVSTPSPSPPRSTRAPSPHVLPRPGLHGASAGGPSPPCSTFQPSLDGAE